MENNVEKIELTGTVVFFESNAGSKSEAVLPHLYVNRHKIIRILIDGDNPFENNMLQEYDGKKITISGIEKSNGNFINYLKVEQGRPD